MLNVNIEEFLKNEICDCYNQYVRFTENFYDHLDEADQNINLRKYKIDDALENRHFMNDILPSYLSALNRRVGSSDPLWKKLQYDWFQFRVKSLDTLTKKMHHDNQGDFYVAKIINDLFGERLIISGVNKQLNEIENLLTILKEAQVIHRFYFRVDGKYQAFHCYIQDSRNHLPWEIQIWDSEWSKNNYKEHLRHEKERNVRRG